MIGISFWALVFIIFIIQQSFIMNIHELLKEFFSIHSHAAVWMDKKCIHSIYVNINKRTPSLYLIKCIIKILLNLLPTEFIIMLLQWTLLYSYVDSLILFPFYYFSHCSAVCVYAISFRFQVPFPKSISNKDRKT